VRSAGTHCKSPLGMRIRQGQLYPHKRYTSITIIDKKH
jgi:hypothetical protein